ncbi:hypothetical protein NEDG_00276 [Nematocida displodere]|uniref:Uncharacterized protein n=1 Tax=Nematocida displodere TaxID=1805483 RepID=A0A177EK12_9MICR|nr:hypothetical protein NEDG_00276 [Nematocida displodere]
MLKNNDNKAPLINNNNSLSYHNPTHIPAYSYGTIITPAKPTAPTTAPAPTTTPTTPTPTTPEPKKQMDERCSPLRFLEYYYNDLIMNRLKNDQDKEFFLIKTGDRQNIRGLITLANFKQFTNETHMWCQNTLLFERGTEADTIVFIAKTHANMLFVPHPSYNQGITFEEYLNTPQPTLVGKWYCFWATKMLHWPEVVASPKIYQKLGEFRIRVRQVRSFFNANVEIRQREILRNERNLTASEKAQAYTDINASKQQFAAAHGSIMNRFVTERMTLDDYHNAFQDSAKD